MNPRRTEHSQPSLRGLLVGERVDRRTILCGALRAAAGAGLTLGVPAVLGGCGEYLHYPPQQHDYLIQLNQDRYVAFPGIESLINDRAQALDVSPQINYYNDNAPPVEGTDLQFYASTNGHTINDATDKTPLSFDVIVVQPIDPALLAPIAQVGLRNGAKIVSVLTPLEYQTAQITVDAALLGTLLATDAAAWARANLHGPATALYLSGAVPAGAVPQSSLLANSSTMAAEEQAIRAALARLVPNLTVTTLNTPQAVGDMAQTLRSDSSVRIVLCAVDSDAVSVAQLLRAGGSQARRHAPVYVGGLGGPTVLPAALAELRLDGALRALAAVRPRDLAYALVDLPVALLANRTPYDVAIPGELVTPNSPALSAYMADYAEPETPKNAIPTGGDASAGDVILNQHINSNVTATTTPG